MPGCFICRRSARRRSHGLTNWCRNSSVLCEYHGYDLARQKLPLGVRQRLSLAVAVIHKPEILILDEPTSGVDPIARDRFWELLVDLSRDQGVTIFISTHFMNEAERCDRISLMDDGKVLASGARRLRLPLPNMVLSNLEAAFISVSRGRQRPKGRPTPDGRPYRRTAGSCHQPNVRRIESTDSAPAAFSFRPVTAYSRRETTGTDA